MRGTVCRHFLTGTCRMGSECRFLHTTSSQQQQAQQPPAEGDLSATHADAIGYGMPPHSAPPHAQNSKLNVMYRRQQQQQQQQHHHHQHQRHQHHQHQQQHWQRHGGGGRRAQEPALTERVWVPAQSWHAGLPQAAIEQLQRGGAGRPVGPTFRCMSYNILADEYAVGYASELYHQTPRWCLQQRLPGVLREVGLWRPDIVCMQEVDGYEQLAAGMYSLGYRGVYEQRSGGRKDGCATFWNPNVLRAVGLDRVQMSDHGLKDNVALLLMLQPVVAAPQADGLQQAQEQRQGQPGQETEAGHSGRQAGQQGDARRAGRSSHPRRARLGRRKYDDFSSASDGEQLPPLLDADHDCGQERQGSRGAGRAGRNRGGEAMAAVGNESEGASQQPGQGDGGGGGAGGGGAGGGVRLLVANTHVHFNPKRGDVKLGQLRVILDRMWAVASSSTAGGGGPIACMFMGDFNLSPGSPLYDFIRSGELGYASISRFDLAGQVEGYGYPQYFRDLARGKQALQPYRAPQLQLQPLLTRHNQPPGQGQQKQQAPAVAAANGDYRQGPPRHIHFDDHGNAVESHSQPDDSHQPAASHQPPAEATHGPLEQWAGSFQPKAYQPREGRTAGACRTTGAPAIQHAEGAAMVAGEVLAAAATAKAAMAIPVAAPAGAAENGLTKAAAVGSESDMEVDADQGAVGHSHGLPGMNLATPSTPLQTPGAAALGLLTGMPSTAPAALPHKTVASVYRSRAETAAQYSSCSTSHRGYGRQDLTGQQTGRQGGHRGLLGGHHQHHGGLWGGVYLSSPLDKLKWDSEALANVLGSPAAAAAAAEATREDAVAATGDRLALHSQPVTLQVPYAPAAAPSPADGSGLLSCTHPLPLQSAYLDVTGCEPAYTTSHTKYIGTVDFIWYTPVAISSAAVQSTAMQEQSAVTGAEAHQLAGGSSGGSEAVVLRPMQCLLPPDAARMPRGMPNPQWPSDHISLLADFQLWEHAA